jgi:hypothetical protein
MAIRYDVAIDWSASPRLLTVASPSTEITVQEIVDTCRFLEDSSPGENYEYLIDAAGKEPLGGDVYVGITATLNNAYIAFEARAGPDWILCIISGGNLVAEDDVGAELDPRYPTAFTTVDRTASSSATLTEQSAIQYASFGGGVTIDIIRGVPGTEFPIGTQEEPVDNLVDAITIANERGFFRLYINESMSIDAGTTITEFEVVGRSSVNTFIYIDPAAICEKITISSCTISGTLDGGSTIDECIVGNLAFVNGHIHSSELQGTIILDGDEDAIFINCVQAGTTTPIIDMGGGGQNLSVTEYTGRLIIKNLTNPGNTAGLGVSAGNIILDSSITAGVIIVSGVGVLNDNSTSVTVLNTDGLMSKETITEITWEFVDIDVNNGSPGTAFPIGTATTPSNNISDAVIIANDRNIRAFRLRGSIILPQAFDSWTFLGVGATFSDNIDLNGKLISNCRFESVSMSGIVTSTYNQFVRCNVKDTTGLNGTLLDSALEGSISLGGIGSVLTGQNIGVYGSTPGTPAVIDMVGTGRVFQASMDGAIQFSNLVAGSFIQIGLTSGTIILDPTCSGGNVVLTGVGTLYDYSTATVINSLLSDDSIADAVVSEPTIISIDKKTKLIPGLM